MGSSSAKMEMDDIGLSKEDLSKVSPIDLTELFTPISPPSRSQSPTTLDHEGLTEVEERAQFSDESSPFEVTRSRNIMVEIPRSTLITPKSRHYGFVPPVPRVRESIAVAQLLALSGEKATSEDFIEFDLDSFSFYVNSKQHSFEMRSLQFLSTKTGHSTYYLDGVMSVGSVKHYISGVEVTDLPIGNYGIANASVGDQIWVRSKLNLRREVYYRLKKPATEYERFYAPFLWIANLAKHVVDFTAEMIHGCQEVSLLSFKEDFIHWLREKHTKAELQGWLRQHPSTDFRASVHANIDFIWKEIHGVMGNKALGLQLFRETMHFSEYAEIPTPPGEMIVSGDQKQHPTIVTPYVKECFGHMVIGKMLRLAGDDVDVPAEVVDTEDSQRLWKSCNGLLSRKQVSQIKIGDTLSTPRDADTTDTKWKLTTSKNAVDDGRWFGLVQNIHISKNGHRTFDVTWLYRPAETPCCVMKYPWANELFLSDHCTCEEGYSSRIKEAEILAVHAINWFGGPNDSGDRFFIRQMYMVEERRWVTLRESHLRCSHGKEKLGFKAGDTILAVPPSHETSTDSQSSRSSSLLLSSRETAVAEPFEVVKIFKQGASLFVKLRRLLRRNDLDRSLHAPPNELVYTDQLVVVKPGDTQIIGKCYIRFFRPEMPIPSPYNRNGTGNLFYITHRLNGDGKCLAFSGEFPTSLRQGFDPSLRLKKMRGLDLFCGAGNFGRGLEDGGVVEMRWANDIWDRAIHTYMVNTPHPKATHPFLGSVDDLLREAIEGKFRDAVPRPGEVDFISAGSPCPGFSLLTQDKTTLKQVKNQSLVASFASFVDFYRPKYGILENVENIVPAQRNRKEDILSQLFCAIIGMGYQAQLILGDAWSHGAPQMRKRVFLYFAAPGLRLPDAPLPSHSHPPGTKSRGLGELCNGEPFVRRLFDPTAFKYVSAREGCSDLEPIYDGKPASCVAHPDHRVSINITRKLRAQFAAIPSHPYGMNFSKAWKQGKGVMNSGDRELFHDEGSERVKPISQGWTRQNPNRIFSTVTTSSQPTNARSGAGLHWFENRTLSVMEIRRAQGFQDHEVLLGKAADQWKLVGNSVARPMALALGLKFRQAWLGSLYEDTEGVTSLERSALQSLRQETALDSASTSESRCQSESEEPARKYMSGFTPGTAVSETPGERAPTLGTVERKRSLPEESHSESHPAKVQRLEEAAVHSDWRSHKSRSRSRSATPQEMMAEVLPISLPLEQINGVTMVRLK